MHDMHGIAKAIDAFCDEERKNRIGKSSWRPLDYEIESPLIPASPLFGINYDGAYPICVLFFRRYDDYSEDGVKRIVELYSDSQWKSLCEATKEYRDNWLRDRDVDHKAKNDRSSTERLEISFTRKQIPEAIHRLVTKGWGIPEDTFRARWRQVIVGM